ncbi:MAG: phosphate ABC transporter permease PstA [Deltaproteobacteria bacterium]|nr:phosphate ABC transporter permease PstA [Deltaproteobacteria bacterium]
MKAALSRRVRSAAAFLLTALCVVIALVPLLSLAWLVVSRGWAGFSWALLTEVPGPPGGAPGGVGNALAGTGVVVFWAALLGLPLGIGAGVFLAESDHDDRLASAVRFTADVLAGVPSIVAGIVAYGLIVAPMKRFSALAGAVALAVLMLPALARTTEELVRRVPGALREGGLALGIPQWKTSLRIVLPAAAAGIATAVLLSIARIAGETGPLLFTSLNNAHWSLAPDQPIGTLTVQLYNDAISPYPAMQQRAWATALLLLVVVGLLNMAARVVAGRRAEGAHG